jgi:hypothetical protein
MCHAPMGTKLDAGALAKKIYFIVFRAVLCTSKSQLTKTGTPQFQNLKIQNQGMGSILLGTITEFCGCCQESAHHLYGLVGGFRRSICRFSLHHDRMM